MLVEVYNFKIKCLNVENIVKAYISRNNLQEYNHVNLNCVLMDDLKMKSQSIQIESRIKDMMLKELPETAETSAEDIANQVPEVKEEADQSSLDLINMELLESTLEEEPPLDIDLHESKPLIELENVDDYDNTTDSSDSDSDAGNDEVSESDGNDKTKDKPPTTSTVVAVRKDLFSTNSEIKSPTPSLIVNNQVINQNGKIIIKIDRACLKPLSLATPNNATNNVIVTPAVISSLEAKQPDPSTPKIVSVETVEGSNTEEGGENADSVKTMYNCNKCNYITEDVIEMYDHNRSFHNFDYTCQHCPFSTSKVELLGKLLFLIVQLMATSIVMFSAKLVYLYPALLKNVSAVV